METVLSLLLFEHMTSFNSTIKSCDYFEIYIYIHALSSNHYFLTYHHEIPHSCPTNSHSLSLIRENLLGDTLTSSLLGIVR